MLFILLLFWVFAASVGISAAYRWQLYDEAYIYLRYAGNLLRGEGLVFNPSERVEAFGSALWVLICAVFQLLHTITGWSTVGLLRSFTILVAAGNIALLFALSKKIITNPRLALVPPAFMAADNIFLVNAVMGLEDQMLLFLLLSALLAPVPWLRGVIFGAMALARLSSVIFILPFWAGYFKEEKENKEDLRRFRTEGGIFLIFIIPLILWRWYYFGSFLPAEGAYAMPGGGISYIHRFLSSELYLPLLILASYAMLERGFAFKVLSIALLDAVYVLFIGGGADSFSRLLLPIVPLCHLVTGVMVARIWECLRHYASGPVPGSMAVILVSAIIIFGAYGMRNGPYHFEIRRNAELQEARAGFGQWLAKIGKAQDKVLLKDAGAVGYFSNLYVIDIDGRFEKRKSGKRRFKRRLAPEAALARGPTIVPWGMYKKGIKDWQEHGFYLETVFPEELRRFRRKLGPGIWLKDLKTRIPLPGAPVFDFEEKKAEGWEAVTDAGISEVVTTAGTLPRQQSVTLFHGKRYLSTFDPVLGDKVKTACVSPAFRLSGNRLCFLLAGGDDIERLTVNLIIDKKSVKRATGVRSETFGRRCWKIKKWRGKEARIGVVDDSTGKWGHIMIDYIFQSAS